MDIVLMFFGLGEKAIAFRLFHQQEGDEVKITWVFAASAASCSNVRFLCPVTRELPVSRRPKPSRPALRSSSFLFPHGWSCSGFG